MDGGNGQVVAITCVSVRIFEQEMPLFRLCIENCIEAVWDKARGCQRGNLRIELDFATPYLAIAMPGDADLEDEGGWGADRAGVRKSQPDDARDQLRARTIHLDIANATIAHHAGSAKHIRQIFDAGSSRENFARHLRLI
jgi:hypothetical protein